MSLFRLSERVRPRFEIVRYTHLRKSTRGCARVRKNKHFVTIKCKTDFLFCRAPDRSNFNYGAAVGISIGVFVVAGILVAVVFRVIRKQRMDKSKSQAMEKLKNAQGIVSKDPASQNLLDSPVSSTATYVGIALSRVETFSYFALIVMCPLN